MGFGANYSKVIASLSLCLLFHCFFKTFDFRRPKPHTSLAELNIFQPKTNKSVIVGRETLSFAATSLTVNSSSITTFSSPQLLKPAALHRRRCPDAGWGRFALPAVGLRDWVSTPISFRTCASVLQALRNLRWLRSRNF